MIKDYQVAQVKAIESNANNILFVTDKEGYEEFTKAVDGFDYKCVGLVYVKGNYIGNKISEKITTVYPIFYASEYDGYIMGWIYNPSQLTKELLLSADSIGLFYRTTIKKDKSMCSK